MQKTDIYCDQILNGKIPISKVYESDLVLAFHHTKPFYKNHIVVLVKECVLDITCIDPYNTELLSEIQKAIKISIETIGYTEFDSGVKVVTNLGKYQDSTHLHYHVICGEKEID